MGDILYLPVFPCRVCDTERVMRDVAWPGLEMPPDIVILECQVCLATGVYQVDLKVKQTSIKYVKALQAMEGAENDPT